jgi:hypothetical protein
MHARGPATAGSILRRERNKRANQKAKTPEHIVPAFSKELLGLKRQT